MCIYTYMYVYVLWCIYRYNSNRHHTSIPLRAADAPHPPCPAPYPRRPPRWRRSARRARRPAGTAPGARRPGARGLGIHGVPLGFAVVSPSNYGENMWKKHCQKRWTHVDFYVILCTQRWLNSWNFDYKHVWHMGIELIDHKQLKHMGISASTTMKHVQDVRFIWIFVPPQHPGSLWNPVLKHPDFHFQAGVDTAGIHQTVLLTKYSDDHR